MSRDELSVVLLKVFGFTVVIRALIMLPQQISGFAPFLFMDFPNGNMYVMQVFAMLFAAAVQFILGFLVIAKSSSISRWLLALGQGNTTTEP